MSLAVACVSSQEMIEALKHRNASAATEQSAQSEVQLRPRVPLNTCHVAAEDLAAGLLSPRNLAVVCASSQGHDDHMTGLDGSASTGRPAGMMIDFKDEDEEDEEEEEELDVPEDPEDHDASIDNYHKYDFTKFGNKPSNYLKQNEGNLSKMIPIREEEIDKLQEEVQESRPGEMIKAAVEAFNDPTNDTISHSVSAHARYPTASNPSPNIFSLTAIAKPFLHVTLLVG